MGIGTSGTTCAPAQLAWQKLGLSHVCYLISASCDSGVLRPTFPFLDWCRTLRPSRLLEWLINQTTKISWLSVLAALTIRAWPCASWSNDRVPQRAYWCNRAARSYMSLEGGFPRIRSPIRQTVGRVEKTRWPQCCALTLSCSILIDKIICEIGSIDASVRWQ